MIPEELRQLSSQLASAAQAEDVFGLPDANAAKEVLIASVKRTFLRLSHIVDPDFYPSDAEARASASQAFVRLKMYYEQAMQKVEAGTYGAAASPDSRQSARRLPEAPIPRTR